LHTQAAPIKYFKSLKNVIVFGGSGLVGSTLVRKFSENGWRVTSVSLQRTVKMAYETILIDLTDVASYENLPDVSVFDLVVNALAITDVNSNESRFKEAFTLHVKLSRFLAKHSKKYVYISTVAVYGELSSSETNGKISLSNWYSKTKFFGEPNSEHLTLRTNVIGLESQTKRSLLEWAFDHLTKNQVITGFENQFINPVLPVHVFEVIIEYYVEKRKPGIYNLGSSKIFTKFSLLKILAEALGKEKFLNRGRSGFGNRYQISIVDNQIIVNFELKDYVSEYLEQIKRA
jgi:dTDP-4-dehydrorhamnose reductase